MASSCLQPGFTLLDTLVALAIATASLILAVPALHTLQLELRGHRVMQDLASGIYLARSQAAKTGTLTTLCPSTTARLCDGSWDQGILIFSDHDGDAEVDDTDEFIGYLAAAAPLGRLDWRAFRSKPYLQITPLGFTRHQNGSFTWCPAGGDQAAARQLIISRTGRVRFAIDSNGDGLREGAAGQPVACPS